MSNLRSSSTGTTNSGIRSIREMFEKGGSTADSSSPRGLSPADSANSGERPTRKVRTSFVAVEPSGRVDVGSGGDKADGNSTLNGTDSSIQNGEGVESIAANGKEEQGTVGSKETTHTKERSGELRNGSKEKTTSSGVEGEKALFKTTDANQPRNNPQFKAELDKIVAKSAVNGTGEQEKSDERTSSGTDAQAQSQSLVDKTKVGNKSPMNKSKEVLKNSPQHSGNSTKNNKKAIDVTNETNRDNDESGKFKKSPLSTPKRSKAANTMNKSDAILSPRNVALPKSPNSSKSVTKTAQGIQGSPTKTKGASSASAKSRVSSIGTATKPPTSNTEKSSVKSPSTVTAGTGTARNGAPSTRKSSITAANSQKLANSKEKRASLPPANASIGKISGLKGSMRASVGPSNITTEKKSDSSNNPASQPLKSPRRSGPLSAHLTAPTASSTAKHSSQSSQSSLSQSQSLTSSTSAINRKSSTIARDRNAGAVKSTAATSSSSARLAPNTKKTTNTSTTDSKRQHSRASFPSTLSNDATNKSSSSKDPASSNTTAGTAPRGSELSHSSSVRSPGKSFLDRMTRPTASFASKTHEKVDVKSPPPRRSASVRTRPKSALGENGKIAGGRAAAGEGTGTGAVSRTRALQDALIGSKGRKQGAGASAGPTTGIAGSWKETLGSASGPDSTTTKEAIKEEEGAGKDYANDEVKSMEKGDTEQISSVPKQEYDTEVVSAKEETVAPKEDANIDNIKQASLSEMNEKMNEKKEEEKSDEILKTEPTAEAKPEQENVEAKIRGQANEGSHVNGENVDDGNVLENNDGTGDGKRGEDSSKDAIKSKDKPTFEQDNSQETTISSDGMSDPFVMETPKFDRTVIR